ncbi:uncharacterized protein SPAPADRAFT_60486 [Spathaspora passalidarum NRRL Y-27907]|uniref:Uncharacterized protein n=1 Tax=Spathaspora passalidarum (strain NRRL Y-27907 / 11-Y1) TaxID=619300 RepID=G3ALD8_SPAPN|nr:uncharacterized protein SPAPADRAFT_60486 [Spathaspora passalidarum NRRL Y-27907]EGW33181.1 hypothetical protein SPAPADRAFT_60486 [Spathaspora passalidarum NRRL Y-27907]
MTSFLSKDSLFLKLPTSELAKEPTLLDLYTNLQSSTHNYDSLITKTYYLIKSPSLSQSQIIKLWSIRLTLHLFNNQLNYAKKEAIKLNNALYLQETTSNPDPPSRTSSLTSTSSSPMTPIYPLPKSILDFKLLVLLLRLKSIPNMNLVNELYKLNYQLRIKGVNELSEKLNNLSFDVIVVLILTKNYLTLQSMLINLHSQLSESGDVNYNKYKSQVLLLLIIIDSRIYTNKAFVEAEYSDKFSEIDQDTKNALVHASTKISQSEIAPEFTLTDLIKVDITDRVIYSILAIWDLSNIFPFKLTNNDNIIEFSYQELEQEQKEEDPDDLSSDWLVDLAYDELNKHWGDNITKLYALE